MTPTLNNLLSPSKPAESVKIIGHTSCPGDFRLTYGAGTFLGVHATCIPYDHGNTPTLDVTDGSFVARSDGCFGGANLLPTRSLARGMFGLDPHTRARADGDSVEGCLFDRDRSGERLAGDVFRSKAPRPLLIDSLEDRDLMRTAFPEPKPSAPSSIRVRWTSMPWTRPPRSKGLTRRSFLTKAPG